MASVTFSSTVGGNNSTVTDDANATTGLAGGGHRTRFVPALAQIVAIAQYVVNTANSINTGNINAATVTATDVSNNVLRYPAMVDGTGAGQVVELSTARWTMNPNSGQMTYTGGFTLNGASIFTGSMSLTGSLALTGSLNMSSGAINEVSNSDVASAATVNLDALIGNHCNISGTTSISALTLASGRRRTIRFISAGCTLVNSATLITGGGRNIVSEAGDVAEIHGVGSGISVVSSYTKVSGAPIGPYLTQGKQTIPIAAGAMTPRLTAGPGSSTTASTTNSILVASLDFDPAAAEFAQFTLPTPKSYNNGTWSAQFLWTAASGSGNVLWGIRGVALSDDDAIDAAFGSSITIIDTFIAANDMHISVETTAFTVGGSPTTGDAIVFEVFRDGGNGTDTFTADARLIGIRLYYTANAGNDA